MRIFLSIILFLLTLFIFVYIADEMVAENETHFDTQLVTVVNQHQSPAATHFFESVTFFGSSYFLLPAYIVLIIILLIKKRKKTALNIGIVGATSTAVLHLLKEIFKRTRPSDPLLAHVTGFSFPSGHSFSSFTFFALVIYLFCQMKISTLAKVAIGVFFFSCAALIAYSRVYLHVHYPSDVIAGFCLSVIWLLLSYYFLRKKKEDEPQNELSKNI
ncbi:MAG: phosphatase PAP2 family protein [Ginsengibacter sp.]